MRDVFTIGELKAELDRSSAGALRVRLSGRSANRDAGKALAPLFERIRTEARSESLVVSLHFERLEYFNSSTIAALVKFIRSAHEDEVALVVVYDGKQKWQAMSFDALRRALRPFQQQGADSTVRFQEA